MRIEVESTLTRDMVVALQRWEQRGRRKAMFTVTLVLCLVLAVLVAFGLALSIGASQDASPYLLFLAVDVFLLAILFGLPALAGRASFATFEADMLAMRYGFEDAWFEVRSESPRMQEHLVVRYDGLIRAVEDPKHYFLYLANRRALIVSKAAFPEGGAVELGKRLQLALGAKLVDAR